MIDSCGTFHSDNIRQAQVVIVIEIVMKITQQKQSNLHRESLVVLSDQLMFLFRVHKLHGD